MFKKNRENYTKVKNEFFDQFDSGNRSTGKFMKLSQNQSRRKTNKVPKSLHTSPEASYRRIRNRSASSVYAETRDVYRNTFY